LCVSVFGFCSDDDNDKKCKIDNSYYYFSPQWTPSLTFTTTATTTALMGMKRPILDQIATTLFQLEKDRVEASSEIDEKGRMGEPMAWSNADSMANQLSVFMANQGYGFKQFVADLVAGKDYDADAVTAQINQFVADHDIAMFSFTTCPFCRRAKDALEERGLPYGVMELDELEGNAGNEYRAQLGRLTRRTSVPSIFIRGTYIGGCNDGSPGLLPLMESGQLDVLLKLTKQ
jgi:glutaredoxin 3